jgi:hypothetical protein
MSIPTLKTSVQANTRQTNTEGSMEKAYGLINEIAAKEMQAAELLAQLPRSMAIKAMWPEAFEHGSVRTRWRGKLMTTEEWRRADKERQLHFMRGGGKVPARTPRDLGAEATFTIVRGDGSTREFLRDEVPDSILDQLLTAKS